VAWEREVLEAVDGEATLCDDVDMSCGFRGALQLEMVSARALVWLAKITVRGLPT
jgi:hypothetical protein